MCMQMYNNNNNMRVLERPSRSRLHHVVLVELRRPRQLQRLEDVGRGQRPVGGVDHLRLITHHLHCHARRTAARRQLSQVRVVVLRKQHA